MIKFLTAVILIFVALLERIFFDLGPNVELVTMALVLSSFYLGNKYSSFVVLVILIISDLIIGNSSIFIFTWTGFLLPALFVHKFLSKGNSIKNIFSGTLAGVSTNLFFFLWTNLGVWLLSAMYPNTAQGLMMSYLNGLLFLKLQLLSTLLFVPLGFTLFETFKLLSKTVLKEYRFKSGAVPQL